jgi:phage terminase large subunit GpA-like protein
MIVSKGAWRPLRPEIKNNRGYRLNSLVSLLPNANWPKLAEEFLKANRGGPAELQVFTNLVLAKTWRTSINRLSAEVVAGRGEPFSLKRVPPEVILITVGADVQDDRIEACVLGWPLHGAPCVLAHHVIDGNTLKDETWHAFDAFLRSRWPHHDGWELKVDACAVDSGGHEGRTQKVYDFCGARLHRRIYAIRGVAGARPIWTRAQRVKTGKSARLFIVGHDQVKTAVLQLLSAEPLDEQAQRNPHALRVSDELPPEWYDQVTGEVRRVRYVRNRPIIEFVPKKRGQPVEALDALCYAWAVRQSPAVKAIDLRARAARQRQPAVPGESPPRRQTAVGRWASHFNE